MQELHFKCLNVIFFGGALLPKNWSAGKLVNTADRYGWVSQSWVFCIVFFLLWVFTCAALVLSLHCLCSVCRLLCLYFLVCAANVESQINLKCIMTRFSWFIKRNMVERLMWGPLLLMYVKHLFRLKLLLCEISYANVQIKRKNSF